MSQRAGKLLPQQHPFQVGQEVQSVEVIIAVADDVTNENIQEKVASITDGNWKILPDFVNFKFWWDGSKFIPPQPHASWSLNSEETEWEAPVAKPSNTTFTVQLPLLDLYFSAVIILAKFGPTGASSFAEAGFVIFSTHSTPSKSLLIIRSFLFDISNKS